LLRMERFSQSARPSVESDISTSLRSGADHGGQTSMLETLRGSNGQRSKSLVCESCENFTAFSLSPSSLHSTMSSLFRRTPQALRSTPARPLFIRRATPPSKSSLSTSSSPRPTISTTPPTTPQKRSLFLLSSALLSGGVLAGLGLSLVLPRPQLVNLVFPIPTPHPPPSTSPEAEEHSELLEKGLWELPVVKALQAEMIPSPSPSSSATSSSESSLESAASSLRSTSSADTPLIPRWKISRPYAATPAGPHSLSGYSLKGPHKFAIPPLVFTSPDKKEAVLVLHVGKGLCGHEGVIHGGLLATVLDEALGRTVRSELSSVDLHEIESLESACTGSTELANKHRSYCYSQPQIQETNIRSSIHRNQNSPRRSEGKESLGQGKDREHGR